MKHADKARDLFLEGYNCSQAIACAFSDVTGIDEKTSALLASSFGGGMGRMREVCGAVSGALMVLGTVHGYSDPKANDEKKELYVLVRQFADRFREENGSIICRELLEGVSTSAGGNPEQRTGEYYKKRPCPELVYSAAAILDEML